MLPLPCCLLSIRETVAAVSSNAERATAGPLSTLSAWLRARPLISYAAERASGVMALLRQSTGLILNLPSKDWCAIAYTDVDLYVRNNAQSVGCRELVELRPRNLTDCPISQRLDSSKTSRSRSRFMLFPTKRRDVRLSTPELATRLPRMARVKKQRTAAPRPQAATSQRMSISLGTRSTKPQRVALSAPGATCAPQKHMPVQATISSSQYSCCKPPTTSITLISQSRGSLCLCVVGRGRGLSEVFSGNPDPKLE